ncbi:MAG TPA: GNAT family N-acetyltransferase [Nocardioides sp.]|nr:GNAT family N-acetyltransferase [Nocardioides sp.]
MRTPERPDDDWAFYVDAFRTTSRAGADPATLIDEAAILGRRGSNGRYDGRLLVTDDSAFNALERLGNPHAAIVDVVPSASRCVELMAALPGYAREDVTAMVFRDLGAVSEPPLAEGLHLRRAVVDPGEGEVALLDAAAACLRFDPGAGDLAVDRFAAYLASIPDATLFAATDEAGKVRATAGSAVFQDLARIFFVSTDPALRRQGIGTAVTAAALNAARDRGAARVSLDASAAARAIYERLGFTAVGPLVLFSSLG